MSAKGIPGLSMTQAQKFRTQYPMLLVGSTNPTLTPPLRSSSQEIKLPQSDLSVG